jgi:hypothetical protein
MSDSVSLFTNSINLSSLSTSSTPEKWESSHSKSKNMWIWISHQIVWFVWLTYCVNICNSYFSLFLDFFEVRCLFVSRFLDQYYSLLCVCEWMNEWVSRCVCLEREMCVCVLIIHIYIYSLTSKIKRCESCVCFQCFWEWLSSFWSYPGICCVCVCEWMNEWMNEWMSRCVCVNEKWEKTNE